jgi:protoporphyrinogen oxidase
VKYTGVKTAILGGGLTGLTLARFLCEAGEEVVVLEAESTVGGLCRSRSVNGFCFDTGGSHIIFSRDREVLAFMLEVLGGNREDRKRNTKIFYKDRLVKYPFENGLSELPKEDSISVSRSSSDPYCRREENSGGLLCRLD